MMAGLNVARSINIPVVMGIFPSFKLQKLAKRIGMRVSSYFNIDTDHGVRCVGNNIK